MNTDYIEKIRNEYIKKYYSIPIIQKYIEITNVNDMEIAGYFNADELYKKEYNFHINTRITEESDYSKAILFHEFTHVYDSIQLLDYEYDKYRHIMQSCSEVHAAEIEMEILVTIEKFPIEFLMNQHLNDLVCEFTLPDGPFRKGCSTGFNYRLLYYLIGYIKALKHNGIGCGYSFKRVPDPFREQFEEISNYYLDNDEYDNEKIFIYQSKLDKDIRQTKYEHQMKFYKESKSE